MTNEKPRSAADLHRIAAEVQARLNPTPEDKKRLLAEEYARLADNLSRECRERADQAAGQGLREVALLIDSRDTFGVARLRSYRDIPEDSVLDSAVETLRRDGFKVATDIKRWNEQGEYRTDPIYPHFQVTISMSW